MHIEVNTLAWLKELYNCKHLNSRKRSPKDFIYHVMLLYLLLDIPQSTFILQAIFVNIDVHFSPQMLQGWYIVYSFSKHTTICILLVRMIRQFIA